MVRSLIGGLKWINAGAMVGLCVLIYTTQKKIWQLDMESQQQKMTVKGDELKLEEPLRPAEEASF
ncbi:MAG TPA: hypothetical protein VE056_08055 [Pyrinomonadaceae bacterium]|nr:hypothetical protein [Pyrinomonadaceae bacterium]